MKTFFKRVFILALIYLCYGIYSWDINFFTLFEKANYLGDLWSSYSSVNNSRFDVVNK